MVETSGGFRATLTVTGLERKDTSVIQQSAHVLARFPTRGGSLRPRFTYRMEDSKL
jgi:hypothetical protein